ncbi:MAG: ANTAR domain-containing protein [Acidimicrobiia bacterium]
MTTTQETRSRVAELEQTIVDLTRALASRPVIDQAIGILMERHRCPAEDAFRRLRAESQHRNVKLRDVAFELVRAVGGVEPTPPPFLPSQRRVCDDA